MRTNVLFHSRVLLGAVVSTVSLATVACGSAQSTVSAESKPEPIAITTALAEHRPIDRYLRVTGSLTADEQAEVSAEAAGRVLETPVERGSRVAQGTVLARISSTDAAAQLQEAEANAGQIEARLGLTPGASFEHGRLRLPRRPRRDRGACRPDESGALDSGAVGVAGEGWTNGETQS